MAADPDDKLRKSYSFLQKSLSSNITDSDTTIPFNNTTSIPTDTAVDFIIDRIDTNGDRTTGNVKELCSGVVSGSTIINATRGLHGTTAQAHSSGAVVEFIASGPAWNDMVDWALEEHNQDGTHGDVTATSLSNAGTLSQTGVATFTSNIDINDASTAIRDSSDNELVKFAKTASAVNEITVQNAATGNAPQIQATGSDTNIGIKAVAKGTGVNQGFVAAKVGVITGATLGTTGNKAVTGLGFMPKLVRFTVLFSASTGNTNFATGAMTSTSQYYSALSASTSGSATSRVSSTSAAIGWVSGGSSTPTLLATYVSMDSDGFTINVSSANSAFDVAYEALG